MDEDGHGEDRPPEDDRSTDETRIDLLSYLAEMSEEMADLASQAMQEVAAGYLKLASARLYESLDAAIALRPDRRGRKTVDRAH